MVSTGPVTFLNPSHNCSRGSSIRLPGTGGGLQLSPLAPRVSGDSSSRWSVVPSPASARYPLPRVGQAASARGASGSRVSRFCMGRMLSKNSVASSQCSY
jgi:hypothetical protein